jgi:hypothetical protein
MKITSRCHSGRTILLIFNASKEIRHEKNADCLWSPWHFI